MKLLTVVILTGYLLIGCKTDTTIPTQAANDVPPWSTGQSAEAVLGHATFTATGTDSVGQSTIPGPFGLAVSSNGTLFVVDQRAHRILRYTNASSAASGTSADGVLGQPDFASRVWNYSAGGNTPSEKGFESPIAVALDPLGNLFVLDQAHQRVLRFNNAAGKANGASADGVLGQPNFTSSSFNTNQTGFFSPQGIAVDGSGNLYVADGSNHRVLRFNNAAAKSNGAPADAVFGQRISLPIPKEHLHQNSPIHPALPSIRTGICISVNEATAGC